MLIPSLLLIPERESPHFPIGGVVFGKFYKLAVFPFVKTTEQKHSTLLFSKLVLGQIKIDLHLPQIVHKVTSLF